MSHMKVTLTYKGQTTMLSDPTTTMTVSQVKTAARQAFALEENSYNIKLLYKGKVLGTSNNDDTDDDETTLAFPSNKNSKIKVMVMATPIQSVQELNSKRSDPTVRGFDQERKTPTISKSMDWGPMTEQHKEYKFCRFTACTWQSFGHRANSKTPHAFEAMKYLERLATDPGIRAVMLERELVVGTLGEMDPIDDRLMQKKAEEGACLLGYNTNAGARIDVKLRRDTLEDGFLPYDEVAATVLHELSHNWVSDHNALFWTNYGQMRVEYLHAHATLASQGYLVRGRTTADIAGVSDICRGGMESISKAVLQELRMEMAKHGIPVQMVAPAIIERCQQLTQESASSEKGQKLGHASTPQGRDGVANARELALAAAERRRHEAQKEEEKDRNVDKKKE